MIALLGPPPQDLLARGNLTYKFFSDDGRFAARLSDTLHNCLYYCLLGTFSGGISIPNQISLEEIETSLEGQAKKQFLHLMQKMLQWEASKRSPARELVEDEWIRVNTKFS